MKNIYFTSTGLKAVFNGTLTSTCKIGAANLSVDDPNAESSTVSNVVFVYDDNKLEYATHDVTFDFANVPDDNMANLSGFILWSGSSGHQIATISLPSGEAFSKTEPYKLSKISFSFAMETP